MRYGENPHQWAAFYKDGSARPGVATAEQVQGKTLSYNNINDTDAAFELRFGVQSGRGARRSPSSSTPIRAALPSAGRILEAYSKALACDPVSAYGGIVAVNREIDADAAEEIVKIFTEVIVAPSITEKARAIFEQKKNLRVPLTGGLADPKSKGLTFRSVSGGLLVQTRDNRNVDDCELEGRHQARADRGGTGRPQARLQGGQVRQVQRRHLCARRRNGRHRRRTDVARRFLAHRRA